MWKMVENVTPAFQRLKLIIDMGLPIGAQAALEDHGQWMCTSLENVCRCLGAKFTLLASGVTVTTCSPSEQSISDS